MAAGAALGVVKQIQALADGPPTPEMRDCLGQVVASLLFFLDHPDSRVRMNAARTLLKLTTGYPDDMLNLDLSRARSALERCQASLAEGNNDTDSEEFQDLLTSLLEGSTNGHSKDARRSDPATSSAAAAATSSEKKQQRGEVVLKVGDAADSKVRAAMLDKVVAVAGVVSLTFEGEFVIVSTRSPDVAADASFLADLLSAVKKQGVEGVSLVSAAAAGDRAASTSAASDTTARGSSVAASSSAPPEAAPTLDGDEAEEGEPAYLDDEEDQVMSESAGSSSQKPKPPSGPESASGGYASAGGFVEGVGSAPQFGNAPQWTFFSQNTFMTGRRIQEFDDDPSISARLAKKKKQEQQKRSEEKSRLGRLSSWLTGR
eukprot:TRINITY_DN108659_c0_g1_i1.p1 TRINITY_DN108659_c0_g1~~TRINITY_DN108659_c0_g1_i1.p1  ORF type:complete len:374 (+),score=109.86 TRINITY_DN108659_c0_g1_i1:29-1150(+)